MNADYEGQVKPRLSVTLETTQGELVNAGIDPQDYYFERMQKKSLVNSEQIARLDENMALTTTEVGRIKGLFNRIKEFFKGKGEKYKVDDLFKKNHTTQENLEKVNEQKQDTALIKYKESFFTRIMNKLKNF